MFFLPGRAAILDLSYRWRRRKFFSVDSRTPNWSHKLPLSRLGVQNISGLFVVISISQLRFYYIFYSFALETKRISVLPAFVKHCYETCSQCMFLLKYCYIYIFFTRYSTDEGLTWKRYNFTTKPIHVYGLLTEPGETTTIFTIFGSYRGHHSWLVIQVNVSNVLGELWNKLTQQHTVAIPS
jgi:hypothetical protein